MNDASSPNIRNVWVENLEIELPIISDLLEKYPYVAMVRITHKNKSLINLIMIL